MALTKNDVAFIVSSSSMYTLPRNALLDSLCPQTELVYVAVNMYDADLHTGREHMRGSMRIDDASYIFMKGGSWDYVGQIWASQLDSGAGATTFTHAFFLQDTMIVDPTFVQYVLDHTDPNVDATAVYGGQCNLMCCRMDYVRSRRVHLARMYNCTKKESIDHEGLLYKTASPDRRASYPTDMHENRTPVYPYESDVPRITEYYGPIGITKYKANYGQTREGTYYVNA